METNNYPFTQRRIRSNRHIRELAASIKLSHKSFIQPLFADESLSHPQVLQGLGEVRSDTESSILETIESAMELGCSKFLLFPIPKHKALTEFDFSYASRVFQAIKKRFGNDVWVASDVCLCSYTTHGHCGILSDDANVLLNDPTVKTLANYALILAQSGADCIAPSDMMDGRIAAIRTILDAHNLSLVSIMSYAVKFSSQFYGPFRDACHSSPAGTGLKDRKTYQMSPLNISDALASAIRDEDEGADIIMIKPAAFYTDVIQRVKDTVTKPIAAYHVSGEFAAIEALVEKGYCDRIQAHTEVWAALQRSGADIIISYAAKNAKSWIEQMIY